MSGLFSSIGRKGLFLVDPEKAHGLSVAALKSGFLPTCMVPHDPRLQQTVAGLVFPNPLGMAAGYDKNAEVPGPLLRLGFGFTEIGTVTPLAQSGNPKPRIFRLVEDEGVINRPVSTMKAMRPRWSA
jgi:dihydroorotate dehydrogenase